MSFKNVNVNVGGPKKDAPYTYKEVILKPNKSFAEQVTATDRIYVIKWDFDLDGEEVTIPENCVFKFEGGSLSNGSVTLNKTYVDSYGGFKTDISVNGTVTNDAIYSEWFEMPSADSFNSFKNIVNIANSSNKPIYIKEGEYRFVNDGTQIVIKQSIDFNNSTITLDTNGFENFYFILRNSVLENVDSSFYNAFQNIINTRIKHNNLLDVYKGSMIIVQGNDDEIQRYHQSVSSTKQKEFFYVDNNGYRYNDFYNDRNSFGEINKIQKFDCNVSTYFKNVKIVIDDNFSGQQTNEYRYIGLWVKESANCTLDNVIVPYTGIEDYNYILVRINNCYNVSINNCILSNTKDSSETILGEPSSYIVAANTVIGLNFNNIKTGNLVGDAWGATGNNYITDFNINNCSLSRIDVHYRLNNLAVQNCVVGKYGITYTGFGTILVNNTRFQNSVYMFRARADYAAFFDGNIRVSNCTWFTKDSDSHIFNTVYHVFDWKSNCSRLAYITARNITINNLYISSNTRININYFTADNFTELPDTPYLYQPSIYIDNIISQEDEIEVYVDFWYANNKIFANPINVTFSNVKFKPKASRKGHIIRHGIDVDWEEVYSTANNYDNVIRFNSCDNVNASCIFPNCTNILNDCLISFAYATGLIIENFTYRYTLQNTVINNCRFIPRLDLDDKIKLPYNDGAVYVNGLLIDSMNDDSIATTISCLGYKSQREGYIGDYFVNGAGVVYYDNCFVSKRIADSLNRNPNIPLPCAKQVKNILYYYPTYKKLIIVRDNIQTDTMGYSVATKRGPNRPTLTADDRGYVYYDTSLNPPRPIWFDGFNEDTPKWVDATGATV